MEEIAQVYARSLFEVARENGDIDVVREQIGAFADALDETRELQMFFFSPYFSTEEKEDGLDKAVTDGHPTVVNFLKLLLENHRMPVIFRVRREYDRLWEEANKLLPVQITSAVELDPSVAQRIGDEIGRQTGLTVELTSTVDPEVLGGIVVRVGNSIIDAHPTIVNFLKLLLENHRMPVVFRVRREYDRLWEDANKLLPVQITSAVDLDPSIAQRIGDEIGRQTGRTVELTSTVDPEVLGGIVVRVGNSIVDASIRTRLENLRKQVVKA